MCGLQKSHLLSYNDIVVDYVLYAVIIVECYQYFCLRYWCKHEVDWQVRDVAPPLGELTNQRAVARERAQLIVCARRKVSSGSDHDGEWLIYWSIDRYVTLYEVYMNLRKAVYQQIWIFICSFVPEIRVTRVWLIRSQSISRSIRIRNASDDDSDFTDSKIQRIELKWWREKLLIWRWIGSWVWESEGIGSWVNHESIIKTSLFNH